MGGISPIVRWLAAAAVVVVVVLLARYLDWSTVHQTVISVGPWFVVVAAIDALALACDAASIWSFVGSESPLSYSRALLAQATGYAVNQWTPGNALGEPVKIGLLANHAASGVATSAVVLYNLATVVVGVVVVVIGTPLALFALDLPTELTLTVGIGALALVVIVSALVLWIRHGMCATLISVLHRYRVIRESRAIAWRKRTHALDEHLRIFGSRSSHRGIAWVAASRVLHAAGTLVLLHAIGMSFATPLPLAIVTLGIVVQWAANLMPFGLGIADGGHYLLYAAFGASPDFGLAYAMVERARACVASMVALAIAGVLTIGRRVVVALPKSRTIPHAQRA